MPVPAPVPGRDLVDAVLCQRREESGEIAVLLGNRVALPELANLAIASGSSSRPSCCRAWSLAAAGGVSSSRTERAYTCARGPRPRLLRHLGVGADRTPGALGAARSPRQRAAALRLRRGDSASD